MEISRNLDQVEDNIRDLLLQKNDEYVTKAEPLFAQKQKFYDILNAKIT